MGPWPCTTGDPNPGAGPQNPHNRFPPPPRYPIRPTLISPPTPTCESGGPVNLEKAAPSPVDSGRLALAAVLFVPRLSSPASTSLALSPPISCISSDRRERTPRDRRLLSGRQGGQPSSPPTRRRRYPSRPFSSSSRSSSELENKTYLYAASGGHRPKATRNCPSSDRRRHVSHYSDLFSAYLGEITYVHRDVSTSPEPRSELTSAWRHIPSSPRPPPPIFPVTSALAVPATQLGPIGLPSREAFPPVASPEFDRDPPLCDPGTVMVFGRAAGEQSRPQ